MKFYWVLLLIFPALSLAGCGPSQVSAEQAQPQPAKAIQLQEPSLDATMRDPDYSQLPVPTVGSVVITNTTATPISPEMPASALTPTPALQKLAEQAKEDLANRLNLDVTQIDLLKLVPARWPYDNPGCPPSEGKQVDENQPGYQILLTANGQTYTYHTDGKDWIVQCNLRSPNEIRTLP